MRKKIYLSNWFKSNISTNLHNQFERIFIYPDRRLELLHHCPLYFVYPFFFNLFNYMFVVNRQWLFCRVQFRTCRFLFALKYFFPIDTTLIHKTQTAYNFNSLQHQKSWLRFVEISLVYFSPQFYLKYAIKIIYCKNESKFF